jgi:hypothetical protein
MKILYCTCGCQSAVIFAQGEVIAVRTKDGASDIARLPLTPADRASLLDGVREGGQATLKKDDSCITITPKESTLTVEWKRRERATVVVGIYFDDWQEVIKVLEEYGKAPEI